MKAKPFNNKLHEYLRTANVQQGDFAKAVGVDQSLVSLWINNKRVPSIDNLKKIARLTGLKMEEVV